MTRVIIVLTEQEMERLHQSAKRDLRHPRDQARYILRSALLGQRDSSPTNSEGDATRTGLHVAPATT